MDCADELLEQSFGLKAEVGIADELVVERISILVALGGPNVLYHIYRNKIVREVFWAGTKEHEDVYEDPRIRELFSVLEERVKELIKSVK